MVNVAPGFLRNKLFPQHLGLPGISKYIEKVEKARQAGAFDHLVEAPVEATKVKKTDYDERTEAAAVLQKLESKRLSIRRTTPYRSNEVKQPVDVTTIIHEVRRQFGIELHEANITLPKPLSSIQDYEVPVRLPSGFQLPGGKEQIFLNVRVRRK